MEASIKHRLVGIAVVFSLAIIFLPMILDGAGVRKETLDVVIPPQPLVSANPEFEPKLIELQTGVKALPELEKRYVDENSGDTGPEPAVASKPAAKPEPAAGPEPAGDAQPAATPATQVARSEPAARTGGDSWVLQVGSFQDRDKALKERDRMRQSQIAAVFIEQFALDGKTSYRVRLGPFVSRDQTRVAQNKVKAKYDIDGIIMKYER